MSRYKICIFLLSITVFATTSCHKFRGHYGGSKSYEPISRKISMDAIALPEGYQLEAVATGLTYPTSVAFDEDEGIYVTESGYSYGEVWTIPRLLKIESDGSVKEIARGDKNGPWTGVDYKNGYFYVSEGGHLEGGRILKISRDGKRIQILASNLPSQGDHHTNMPLVGNDGYVYFGQGTATNSGVVGNDNFDFGWMKRNPQFHDIPCKDITLTGKNFTTQDFTTFEKNDKTETGAFSPYGKMSMQGQVIKGQVPCTGAIMRVPVEGGPVEVVAWGLRNPYGLAFAPDGRLFATENSYDVRGSRPGYGTGDVLWHITQGSWYGWPDYAAGQPLATDDYQTPQKDPEFLLLQHPQKPPLPSAILGVHSSSNGFDFSRNENFGYVGEVFIAQFGDMAPDVGRIYGPVGFKVVRANINTGVISDFAVNKGKKNGPASELNSGGIERPNAARFDPTGTSLYIVDFGVMPITEDGPAPKKETGVLWKITRTEIAKANNNE